MKRGTCPVCGHTIPIFGYASETSREVGKLSRHSPTGLVGGREAVPEKCRGSFGHWLERNTGA